MMFIYMLLFENFFTSIKGGVMLFGLASGQTPIAETKITLQCIVNGPETTYRIWNGNAVTPLTTCVISSKCIPSQGGGYRYSILSNGITIDIEKLERSKDETIWTCRDTSANQKEFYLTVYSVPSSITLEGTSHACDLGTSACQFTCTTNGCTYPAPVFSWFYTHVSKFYIECYLAEPFHLITSVIHFLAWNICALWLIQYNYVYHMLLIFRGDFIISSFPILLVRAACENRVCRFKSLPSQLLMEMCNDFRRLLITQMISHDDLVWCLLAWCLGKMFWRIMTDFNGPGCPSFRESLLKLKVVLVNHRLNGI